MKMQILFFCLIISGQIRAVSEWIYSHAAACASKEQWKKAQEGICSLLVNNPEQPDLLYDAGVIAYKLKEFEKAQAYFSSAVEQKEGEKELCQQSYFNLGNTKVALHKLPDALQAYEKALEIDPTDQRAQHNRDKVKEMIELQKQQQQQDQKNDNQQNNENEQDPQEGEKEEQKSKSDSSEDSKEKNQKEQNKSSEGDDQENKQEKESRDSTEDQKKEGSQQQQKGNHENKTTHKSDDNQAHDDKDQGGNNHASSSHNNEGKKQISAKKQDIKRNEKAQEMQEGQEQVGDYRQEELADIEDKLAPQDKWMAHALRTLEKAEENEQKKLIKAQANKQAIGDNDQNCW